MLKTIEGIYQNGHIELSELPQDISSSAQVLVTFLDPDKLDPAKVRQLLDQIETIADIQQGFDDVNSGNTRPLSDFIQSMQQQYDIAK